MHIVQTKEFDDFTTNVFLNVVVLWVLDISGHLVILGTHIRYLKDVNCLASASAGPGFKSQPKAFLMSVILGGCCSDEMLSWRFLLFSVYAEAG